jgi:hypothetical protein
MAFDKSINVGASDFGNGVVKIDFMGIDFGSCSVASAFLE